MDISRSLENTGIGSQQDVHLASRKSGQNDDRVSIFRRKFRMVGACQTIARQGFTSPGFALP